MTLAILSARLLPSFYWTIHLQDCRCHLSSWRFAFSFDCGSDAHQEKWHLGDIASFVSQRFFLLFFSNFSAAQLPGLFLFHVVHKMKVRYFHRITSCFLKLKLNEQALVDLTVMIRSTMPVYMHI